MGKGSRNESTMKSGHHKDYLAGLDHLRQVATDLEIQLDKIKREYYNCEANVDDLYEAYLKDVNEKLLYCNSKLRNSGKKLEVIDSELKLVGLLNQMRDLAEEEDIDSEVVGFLTEFWEHEKCTLEDILALAFKYRSSLLKKLKQTCTSQSFNGENTISLTSDYSVNINKYNSEIEQLLTALEQVIKSFENGIRQDLFTNTNFSDRILISCDRKAFPILSIFPDVVEKLSRCVTVGKQWVDKDQTYIHDIHHHIRETRHETRKQEADLRSQKNKKVALDKSSADAFSQFEESKTRLAKLDSELQTLDHQIVQYSEAKKYKSEEKRQKEGIVSFLDISITQTKKNLSLQLKRSRLMRQLRELEENLHMIENEIKSMQFEKQDKSKEQTEAKEEVKESQTVYLSLKTELDTMKENLNLLEREVGELTDSLTELETIESFKTSPERIDDFYDRPASVKISKSLRDKIIRKRKVTIKKLNSSQY